MKRGWITRTGFWAGVFAGLLGCGPGAVAEAIRPNAPTASTALQEGECRSVDSGGEPLVVDWKPDQRGDLEIAMREGVAVVAYSCEGVRLLKDCHIDGTYGYMGITRKEQVIRLQSADELRANLPFSAVKVGGELQRGASLDIALVMVGKTKTTWTSPTQDDLKGTCDGATHFIRGATLGAFAMDSGTNANARTAAEMFGASASGASSSEKQVKNKEGDLADCTSATPASSAPPAQCGAPLRLVLTALAKAKAAEGDGAKSAAGATPTAAAPEQVCPNGLVLADGKCTAPGGAAAYQCKAEDAQECTAQCDKGSAGSCGALGALFVGGRGGVGRDPARGAQLLKKGCDGGDARSCVGLGAVTADGVGVTADAAAAAKLFARGCDDGEAAGCGLLGRATLAGAGVAADPARAAQLLEKACDGGEYKSCAGAGALVAEGKGASGTKDVKRAAGLWKRACDGGDAGSCASLGELYETGTLRKDPITASMLYQRGCNFGSANACVDMARMEQAKPGGGDAATAQRLYERGCMGGAELGCAALKVLFGQNRVVIPNVQRMQALRTGCIAGSTRDCASVGLLTAASGNRGMGVADLERACMRADAWACAVTKTLK